MKHFFLIIMFSFLSCFAKEQKIPDNWKLLLSKKQITEKLQKAAKKINSEYKGKELAVVMVMKGSLLFVSDLLRQLHPHVTLEFIHCQSYYGGMEKKQLQVDGIEKLKNLQGKHILVVDDIFDSGNTLTQVMKDIEKIKPASLKSLVLLKKKMKKRSPSMIQPDIALFEIKDVFVVGYGLDFEEKYRGLDGIYYIK